jgi:hypothetical protein
MAGERYDQIHRAVGSRVAQVMEDSGADGVATGTATAARTGTRRPVAAAALDASWGKILDAGDALRGIGDVFPRSRHHLPS